LRRAGDGKKGLEGPNGASASNEEGLSSITSKETEGTRGGKREGNEA